MAALVHGRLGPQELDGAGLRDPQVLALAERVELIEVPEYSARFPAQRIARVEIITRAGARFDSGEKSARWEPTDPPTDQELREKFSWLVETRLSSAERAGIEDLVWNCAELPDAGDLAQKLI